MRGAGPETHGEAPPRPPPAPRACTAPHARARPATVPRVARTETGAATPLSDLGLACQGPPARPLSRTRSGNSAQAGGTERDRRRVAPGWLAVMAQFPPPEPHPKRACHARNDPRRHWTGSALHRTGQTCYTGCSTKRLSWTRAARCGFWLVGGGLGRAGRCQTSRERAAVFRRVRSPGRRRGRRQSPRTGHRQASARVGGASSRAER